MNDDIFYNDVKNEVDRIVKDNDIEDIPLHRRRIQDLLDVRKETGIVNNKVFDKSNIEYCAFPTASNNLKLLNACWDASPSSKELGYLMPQYASSVRDLFQLGYQWKRDPKSKENKREHTIIKNGKKIRCRTIYGVDENKIDSDKFSNYIKIGAKEVRKLKKDVKDPLTTSSDSLEIDHRKPIIRSLRQNEAPGYFYKKDLKKSEWKKIFQIISKKMNNIKTRRCEATLYSGNQIEVPKVFQSMQEAGIFQMCCAEDSNCSYCFWANLDNIDNFIERYKEK